MNKTILAATAVAGVFLLSACGEKTATKPAPMQGTEKAQSQKLAPGAGVITSIDLGEQKVTLDHGPIPEIGWSAMTMTFDARDVGLDAFKDGDSVGFMLRKQADGSYAVAMMCPSLGDAGRDMQSMKAMMESMEGMDMMKGMRCPEGTE